MLFLSRFRKKWKAPRIVISKRQSFVLVLLPLCFGLFFVQLVDIDYRYFGIIGLSVLAYFLSALVLREDLSGIEWITLLVLPSIFTLAVGLFYFLVPGRWLTRIAAVVIYWVGMYALLLTENIFNVAANRTIALLRAAHSVGFLVTLVTAFMLFDVILSFRMNGFVNAALSFFVFFPLVLSSFWSVELSLWLSKRCLLYTFFSCLAISEMALAISFWPVITTVGALFLTTVMYEVVGVGQYDLAQRLTKRAVLEFVLVAVVVFGATFFMARWGG